MLNSMKRFIFAYHEQFLSYCIFINFNLNDYRTIYHSFSHSNGRLFKYDNICLKLNCGSNDVSLSRIGHAELEIIGF